MSFWSTLGIMVLSIVLTLGFFYWCKHFFNKLFPNFKYALKYRIFKFKKKQRVVEVMQELAKNNVKGNEAYKTLLCNNIKPKKAKEMIYIQTLMKGGEK